MLVIRAPQAIADLQGIWDYVAEDNAQTATEVVATIRAKAEYLADHPRMGRPGRGRQMRYLTVVRTPYFIVYRLLRAHIENRARHPWSTRLAA